jgi:hypothetical protein
MNCGAPWVGGRLHPRIGVAPLKHWSFMVHFSWWTLGAPLGIFRNYEGMSLAKMVSDIEWVNMSWYFLGCVRRCVSVKYQIMSPMHLSDSNKISWRKYCVMEILTHLRNFYPPQLKKNLPFTNLGTPACRRPLDPFGPTVGTFGFGAAFSSNLKNLMRISAAGCWCKWVIPMVTNGSVRLIHLVTGVTTYLLTGTSHQVSIYNVENIFYMYWSI